MFAIEVRDCVSERGARSPVPDPYGRQLEPIRVLVSFFTPYTMLSR